jgi:hypothetical protein
VSQGTIYTRLLRHIDGQVIVLVMETGAGIEPEIISMLPTKFTQPDPKQRAEILNNHFIQL